MTKVRRPKLTLRAFNIANKIRERRVANGLTLNDMSRLTGQSVANCRAWEKQFGPQCEEKHLGSICRALSAKRSELTGDISDDNNPLDELIDELIISKYTPVKAIPLAHLQMLGSRARSRRKELKLSRHEVAAKIGISAISVLNWEKAISQNITQKQIELWESAIIVPSGWLLDCNIETPTAKTIVEIGTSAARSASDEIRKIACWIASKRGKKTMDDMLLSQTESRALDMFVLRYGIGGEDASKLQAIGDKYGLTRERVRQVVEKMVERTQLLKINTPFIDDLLNRIIQAAPASIADLDERFRKELGENLSVESLDRFSREVLGKGVIHITDRPSGMSAPWEKVVVNKDNHNEAKLRAIRNAAISMIRSCGGAQVNWVAGTASWECGEVVTEQDIVTAGKMIAGFNWLVQEDGWFWFGEDLPSDNRVVTAAKKMLSVAGRRLDSEEIQQGISRSRRYHYDPNRPRPVMIEPPLMVVVAILKQVSWAKSIQHNDFLINAEISLEDVLSESELDMFNAIMASGGSMSRYDIKKDMNSKFSDILLSLNLDSSPIFTQLDRGVFALRGKPIRIDSVKRALDSVGGALSRQVEMVDGYPSCRIKLTEYVLRNKFFEVPAAILPFVDEGDYQVEGFEATARLTIGNGYKRFYQIVQKMIVLGFVQGDTAIIQVLDGKKLRLIKAVS